MRAPAPDAAVSEATVVIELAGVRIIVGRNADLGVIALVVTLLGGTR